MKTGPDPRFFALLLGASVVFGGAINFFAYSRTCSTLEALHELEKQDRNSGKVPMQVQQSEEKRLATKAALQHLEEGVPTAAYVPTMLKQLEALGKVCGIYVTAVRPSAPPVAPSNAAPKAKSKSSKPYDTLDIDVSGVGHYGDALRFLRALDTFPKIVEARSVSLTPATGPNQKSKVGSPNLTLEINLRACLFKNPSDETSPTASEKTHAG